MELKFEVRKLKNGKTVLVLNEEQTRILRAANRQDYQRRLEHNKNCRANIFGNC